MINHKKKFGSVNRFYLLSCFFLVSFLSSLQAEVTLQMIPSDETSQKIIAFQGTRNRTKGNLRHDVLMMLKDTFNTNIFVETGTFLGDTTEVASQIFPEVHTIELSQELCQKANQRFLWLDHVFVHKGDSRKVLPKLLPSFKEPILFYLDGHYSGHPTAHCGINTPILEELSAIDAAHLDQSIILINNMRLFEDSLYPDQIAKSCHEGYPSLRNLVEAILKINPSYQICFLGDNLLAYPKNKNVSVTPLVKACAISRLSASFPELPFPSVKNTHDTIAKASGNERNELVMYYDTYGSSELNLGVRSFSTLWYSLILMQNGEFETALQLCTEAANQSQPGWGVEFALKQAKIALLENNPYASHQSIERLVENTQNAGLLDKAVDLQNNGYSLLKNHLSSKECSIYQNDSKYISQFPFFAYAPIFVPNQGTFFVNEINDTIKNQLRSQIPWETENQLIIEKYVKPGTVALDIGSHIGTHTVTMAKAVGDHGKVFAFEPNKTIYRELCLNLAINDCDNVYPVRSAIGKTKRVIETVASHPNNEGGSYVVDHQGGDNSAVLLPLDAFGLENISFIKIDVENMEADVLDGAQATILKNRPVMLIEVQGNGERPGQMNENSEEMAIISINKIKALGYRLTRVGYADYLAIPKECQ